MTENILSAVSFHFYVVSNMEPGIKTCLVRRMAGNSINDNNGEVTPNK